MEQVQTQALQIKTLLDSSNQFYRDLLGYKPEQTFLKQISETEWNVFAQTRGLNPNSSGIYLPRNQTAVIQEENPLSLFHEYFGHGLYCEQNLTGRKLIDLEKRLLEEEKQEFSNSRFTLEDVQNFRQQNQTFQELETFKQENLGRYELFAIWTEYLLSGEHNLRDEFGRKYDSLVKEDKEAVDSVINFSKSYGDLATFYGFGLRKIQDKKRLLNLSKEIFGNVSNRTKLIIHFGSGKPFSDVDLFVVSDDISSFYSDYWIDVRAYRPKEIEEKIKVLDPMVTDPIMIGRFIFGSKNYQERLKRRILIQPITQESIRFSLQEYKKEKRRSRDSNLSKHFQSKIWRSAKTYLTNALALKNGDKILTFNGLVDYSRKRLSHSEKFIELKGGIE